MKAPFLVILTISDHLPLSGYTVFVDQSLALDMGVAAFEPCNNYYDSITKVCATHVACLGLEIETNPNNI